MESVWRAVSEVSAPLRFGLLGAFAFGVVGALVGLGVGLNVYVPTAWAAAIEIGAPSAVLGGLLGLVFGSIMRLGQHRPRTGR